MYVRPSVYSLESLDLSCKLQATGEALIPLDCDGDSCGRYLGSYCDGERDGGYAVRTLFLMPGVECSLADPEPCSTPEVTITDGVGVEHTYDCNTIQSRAAADGCAEGCVVDVICVYSDGIACETIEGQRPIEAPVSCDGFEDTTCDSILG